MQRQLEFHYQTRGNIAIMTLEQSQPTRPLWQDNFNAAVWDAGWEAARQHHVNARPLAESYPPPLGTTDYMDWRNGVTAYRDEHNLEDIYDS